MSDCGYDNVELNDLINDLKNVGRNEDSLKKETKIAFQYHSPSSALLERRCVKPSPYYLDSDNCFKDRNAGYYGSSRNIKNDNTLKSSHSITSHCDVDNLQIELSLVKEELAMLKRTNSLASHPIFGSSYAPNEILGAETSKRIMVSSQYNLPKSATLSNEIPKNYSNNYGSASNVSYNNTTNNNFQYQSLNRLNNTGTFSAHRDNIEKRKRFFDSENGNSMPERIPKYREDYYEETEDCTLQPIGKGIRTLSGSTTSMTRRQSRDNVNDFRESSIKSVKKMKSSWLQLDASRESCKKKLLNKEAGSFIIRIQTGYKFSGGLIFELILKVSDKQSSEKYEDDNFEYFPLKEFCETNVKGIKLIGHALEPMFYSLESFIVQHLENPLGLPCCLKLTTFHSHDERIKSISQYSREKISRPFNILSKKISGSLTSLSSIKSQFTISTYAEPCQEKMETELLFLGKVKVDRLNGANAVRHAVDKTLLNGYQPKHCIEIRATLDSLSGITLVDNERILFFKKVLNANSIICICVDPLHRGLNSDDLSSRGIKNSKIFGIVCHKKKILLKEHQVYVFGEFNTSMQVEKLLQFVQKHFVKKNSNQY